MKEYKDKKHLDAAKKAVEKAKTQNEISNDVSNEIENTNRKLNKAIVKKEIFEKFNQNKKTSLDSFIDEKQELLNNLRESENYNYIQTLSLIEIVKLAISKLREYNPIEAEKLESAISIKIRNMNTIHNGKLRN